MSDSPPNIFQKRSLINDAVTTFVNGSIFEGWKTVSLSSELNSIADSFSLNIADRWRPNQEAFGLKIGDEIKIYVGKVLLITGYIDDLALDLQAQNRSISISGRSKTGDLVDSSHTGKNEFKAQTILGIINKVVSPFGISASLENASEGGPFDKFTVRQGETAFEIIDRLARQRALIVLPTSDGNFILTKKGNVRASTELRAGVNILSGSANYSNKDRFQKYIVKGQTPGTKGTATQAAQVKGIATDAGISRFRELIVMGENSLDNAGALDRAKYEANIRAARSVEVNVSVQGWFQNDGTIWKPNTIVYADIGFLGFKSEALIKTVTLTKEEGGTRTDLTLIRPDSFEFEKEVSKAKDATNLLGWEKI